MKQKLIIYNCWNTRTANKLIEIGVALSFINDKNIETDGILYLSYNLNNYPEVKKVLDRNKVCYKDNYHSNAFEHINCSAYNSFAFTWSFDEIIFHSFSQYYKMFNENVFQKYLGPSEIYKEKIKTLYPNIESSIVCHIRRGDYLQGDNIYKYYVMNSAYYKESYKKYFNGEDVIILSDDIEWCNENIDFEGANVIFSKEDIITDLYTLSLSKGNICSCSSFSVLGSVLNPYPNKKIIMPYPYYKNRDDENIVPEYAIREDSEKYRLV